METVKVLLVGLGSAGQRHLRNIKRILGDEVEFIAYRVRKYARQFDDNLNVIEGKNVSESYKIAEYDNLEDALDEKPDMAVIANPNSMHMNVAIPIARRGIDIFLEKPISDTLDGIDKLNCIVKENNSILYVGYQMRLHPCIKKLKTDIDNHTIGRIISVDCQMGELITKMHKYEDYRDMNEAKKVTGGGVVLCQIHELDYLYWIFGLPKTVYSIGGKYSDLEIEVEDCATTICQCSADGNEFPVVIHQDFLQSPPVRQCTVIGTNGRIDVDLLQNNYTLYSDGVVREEKFIDFQRNDMFMEEMKTFLECVKTRNSNGIISLSDGLGSLRIALAIKESIRTGETVKM